MKLITKINLNFISAASFVLFTGCVLFYLLLRNITTQNIDDELLNYKEVTKSNFRQLLDYPERFLYFDVFINIQAHTGAFEDSFNDTTLIIANQAGHFRKLCFSTSFNEVEYSVQIHKSLKQADELIIQLLFVLCALIAFFMTSFYFLNRYVSMQGLEGFFGIIDNLRLFTIGQKEDLTLPATDVDEFEELNKVLLQITGRIRKDFFDLKEFTENASHEIQTPLAIITAKVEQLFQDSSLSESQLTHLATVHEATNRLSKLNKGLLLLAKIENHQFERNGEVRLDLLIRKQLENLEELIDNREIRLEIDCRSHLRFNMSPYLLELLVFNLLKNSIKHNTFKGSLKVYANEEKLIVRNTGINEALNVDRLLKRFAKGSQSKSMGLGLAIVKKICDLYAIELQYEFKQGEHKLTLLFPAELRLDRP